MGKEESKNAAKELLLEDYRYLSDSFWKNEQTGETRVNIFIGVVTIVVGALVTLCTSDKNHSVRGKSLRLVVIAALAALLVLGLVTLARILKRNKSTDRCKSKLDAIRQIFKDHFDDGHILVGYNVQEHKKKSREPGMREFGGLAHLMAGINSILFAGIAGVLFYPIPVPQKSGQEEYAASMGWMYALIAAAFVCAFVLQILYINYRDIKNKRDIRKGRHTHAGGVVYYGRDDALLFWLVESKKNPDEWVLPKGHIWEGEGHAEAALREVKEEAGIVARIIGVLDTIEYGTNEEKVKAKYYLMEKLYDFPWHEERNARDFSYEAAKKELRHPENKYILEKAHNEIEKRLKEIDSGG